MPNCRTRLSGARFLVLLVAAAALAPAWALDLGKEFDFKIAPQSLDSALLEFARQANVQVMSSTEEIGTRESPGVSGKHSVSEALDKLLRGTGLRYQAAGDGTIMVTPPANVAQAGGPLHLAQAEPTATGAEPQKASDGDGLELEEIVVTGTHIRGVAPAGSPLIIFSRSDIDRTGAATVGDFLRKVPQNFAQTDRETFQNNGNTAFRDLNAAFGAGVNLRGIGAGATLTLLDGRRLAPAGGLGSFVDVSLIPLSAIERVEMMTDGASAIYGADAVGGVVNFILRRDFSGADTSVRYGDTTDGGGADFTASQALGTSWDGGNAMLVYEYMNRDNILVSQRDFIRPIPTPTTGPFTLTPDERRHSALAGFRQRVLPNLELSGRGFLSTRDDTLDVLSFFGFSARNVTESRLSGGSMGASWDVTSNWNLASAVDYSVMREEVEAFNAGNLAFARTTRADSAGIDVRLTGPVFQILGTAARVSLGVSSRREKFDPDLAVPDALDRRLNSAYGELFIPLIGESARIGAQRLDLSLAGRIDDYDDFGSSGFKPKVGITWAPTADIGLRASWSKSFRAPLLTQLDTSTAGVPNISVVFPLADPTSPTGTTLTLFPLILGNPDLGPEHSTSFTAGVDLTPRAWPNFKASLTYYDIDFEDRIALPPISSVIQLFLHEDELAPFIDRTPDPALIASYFAQPILKVPPTAQAGDVGAFFDNRYHNMSSTKTSGFDLSLSNIFETAVGSFTPSVNVNYVNDLDIQAVSTTPVVSLFDTVFTPVGLKGRGGITWARGALSSGLAVNYVDSYENDLFTPSTPMASWTTVDWQLRYAPQDAANGFLRGLSVTFDVQNLANAEPPSTVLPGGFDFVQTYDFGYDATNATATGRFISLRVAKRWAGGP